MKSVTTAQRNRRFAVWSIAIGFAILAFVAIITIGVDKKNASKTMHDVLEYMKSQCASYEDLTVADITKSLVRLTGKTYEVRRDLERDETLSNEEYLARYADDQGLDRILIFDGDLNLVCGYGAETIDYVGLSELIANENIKNVMNHPEKIFVERVKINGETYDFCAVCRPHERGMIVCFYRNDKENLEREQDEFENLLAGYKMEMNGTLVITDEGRVKGTNDASVKDKDVSDVAVIEVLEQSGKMSGLSRVKSDGRVYYGAKTCYRGYGLYVYCPQYEVFSTFRVGVMAVCLFYFIAMAIFIKLATGYERAQAQEKAARENRYRAELMRSAKEAERANAVKTDFLRRMSHDIRTPLNGICGMLDIADRYDDDKEKRKECREKIRKASGFLLDLVNDVLDMNKLESGEITLEEVPFGLDTLIDGICSMVEAQAKEKGVTIETDYSDVTHNALVGSPFHLRRVLMNIMSNAVKYNREGGSVRLTCRELSSDGDIVMIRFECADTGVGMSEEFAAHAFEPFAQERELMQAAYTGTGLGLPIVKKITEKMGGTVTFESRKNIGTTFFVTIPFKIDPTGAGASTETRESDEPVSIVGARVLLAEDNDLNAEIAEFVLSNGGAIVTRVKTGLEAVEAFEKSAPNEIDAILMDLMMPVMDGLDATRKIRSLSREDARTVPIIAMTANAFEDDVRRCLCAGMNEHLSKPPEARKVIEVIGRLMTENKKK